MLEKHEDDEDVSVLFVDVEKSNEKDNAQLLIIMICPQKDTVPQAFADNTVVAC